MKFILTALVCSLLIWSAPASADKFDVRDLLDKVERQVGAKDNDRQKHRLIAQNRDGLSLSEAIAQVRRQYRGRIVKAETRMRGNREEHIIRVHTDDGRVKTVRIAGRSRSKGKR